MPEPGLDAIEEEAVAWFVRLHDEHATDDDRAAHAAWLATDRRHQAAWADVDRTWAGMEALRGVLPPSVPELPQDALEPPPVRPWYWRRSAIAATVVLLLAGGGVWFAPPPGLFADERTGVGERRAVTLPDGSQVDLAPASALSVVFTAGERRVVLHDGEAYFAVEPDAKRPFRVDAGGGHVTVVGTAFNVKIAAAVVGVSVTRGTVDVAAGAGQPVRLTAGQAVRYDGDGVGPLRSIDPAAVALWREDRLAFDQTPLPDVLRDLDRYRRGRIVVMDAALARLTVSGTFDVRRTDAALDTIARTLPVRLVQITPWLVFVYPVS